MRENRRNAQNKRKKIFQHVKCLKFVPKLLLKIQYVSLYTVYAIKVNKKGNNPLGKIMSQGRPGTSPKDVLCRSPYGFLCNVKGCPPTNALRKSYTNVLRTLKYDILTTSKCKVLGRCPYCPICNAMGHPQPTS